MCCGTSLAGMAAGQCLRNETPTSLATCFMPPTLLTCFAASSARLSASQSYPAKPSASSPSSWPPVGQSDRCGIGEMCEDSLHAPSRETTPVNPHSNSPWEPPLSTFFRLFRSSLGSSYTFSPAALANAVPQASCCMDREVTEMLRSPSAGCLSIPDHHTASLQV